MNKKNLLITLSTISVLCLVLGVTLHKVQGANYFSDWGASDVESDAVVGLLDIYVNVSIIPMSKSDSGYRVIHGGIFIAPRDVLTDIYGYDILQNHDYDFLASSDFMSLNGFDDGLDYTIKAYDDYTETGYTGWSDRSTNSVYRFSEKDMIEGDTNTAVLFNASEYFDDTSVPSDTNNLIIDDESEFVGVQYIAEDGKSVYDYANDVADSFGGTYVETKNGTMIFFGFEDLDNIMNLNVEFDEEIGGTSPLGVKATYITKRRCFRFFQRARETIQEKAKIRTSLFKRITGSISGLVDIPSKATHYVKKTIGSAFHNYKIGVRSIVGNAWAFVRSAIGKVVSFFGGIIGIGFILIVVFIVVRIRKRRK